MDMRLFSQRLMAERFQVGIWALIFASIVAVRNILEAASSRPLIGVVVVDATTFVHYTLFYLVLILLLTWIVAASIGELPHRLLIAALFLLPIIWIAPLTDLLLSGGIGFRMAYIFEPLAQLFRSFLTYFGPLTVPGITPGIRFEIILLIGILFWYVRSFTGNFWRSAASIVFSYTAIFVLMAMPAILSAIVGQAGSTYETVFDFWRSSLGNWNIGRNLVGSIQNEVYIRDVLFNVAMSQIYYVSASSLIILYWWHAQKKQCIAWLQNSRPERVIHYFMLAGLGFVLGVKNNLLYGGISWLEFISLMVLGISIYCAWMWAVGMNDVADIEVDKISNNNRPLISGVINKEIMSTVSWVCFGWALLGGWLLGLGAMSGVVIFLVGYLLHSVKPFRFKKISLLANTLIAVSCLGAAYAGFFTSSESQSIAKFPLSVAALILAAFSLSVHVKDIKDISGDAAAKIPTLLTTYGERLGKRIIGVLLAISFCMPALLLNQLQLWFTGAVSGIIGYTLVQRKLYNERYIFILYFIYAAASLLLVGDIR